MKDDLVEGQEVLRLDDLERLEIMVVQLDEARAFLVQGIGWRTTRSWSAC